ncbi:MAG TPA: Calx-beta domain-containing protein, partial [Verrucomicrobiae bacterium]|nr:Calx-beta domain-containing protein [Verrucomicrobiae bacterium]
PMALAAALTCGFLQTRAETTLFTDDFEGDTSAKWNVYEASGDGTPDYTINWNFDYTQQSYTSNGVALKIPLAPSSPAGGVHGVKMTVNKNDATAATSVVEIQSKDQVFNNNFALRFDMWINYNGGAYGGTGSTEFGMFGVNHTGTQIEWPSSNPSSGLFFAVTGEGGAAGDYRAYEGDPANTPLRLPKAEVFLDHDDDAAVEDEAVDTDPLSYGLNVVYPAPPYETRGVPGKRWQQVEVRQKDGVITWIMNGVVIGRRDNSAGAWTQGAVMLGTMDFFTSIASPLEDNYVIFDNVRVVDLASDPQKPQVTVTATDREVIEPDNNGEFLITRTGDSSNPLTVTIHGGGAATSGTDYQAFPATVTIPAGADSVAVPLTVINDFFGEAAESVQLIIDRNSTYDIVGIVSKVDVVDDGDVPLLSIAALDAVAFEGVTNEPGTFSISRIGDLNSDLTINIATSGTATSDADYEPIVTPIVLPAGLTNVLVKIIPKADAVADDNETVVLTLQETAGYNVDPAAANATVTIREAAQLFADDFETDTRANYTVLFNAVSGPEDYTAAFGYDFSQDVDVKPSPSGSTHALKMTVNKKDTTTAAAAVNAFPNNQSFSGDYLMKFDMFLTYSSSAAGTTEHAIFGVGTSGTTIERHGVAGDGVWFAVETDASSQASRGGTFAVYTGGAAPFTGRPSSDFTSVFPAGDYLASGSPAGAWVDVSVLSLNGRLSLRINDNPILDIAAPANFSAGDIMLGYADSFNSIGSTNNYVLYDNVRVYRIGTAAAQPTVEVQSISLAGTQAKIRFTATNATVFDVYSAPEVTGAFTKDTTATVQSLGGGVYEATVNTTGAMRFFKVGAR